MANNYVDFSWRTPTLSAEELAWFTDYLETPPQEPQSEDAFYESFLVDRESWPYVSYKIEKDHVWFYTECGEDSVDNLVVILQEFLKRFRPKEWLGFEVAYTCSKPRVGEFGGAAVVVSADDHVYKTTMDVIREIARDEFEFLSEAGDYGVSRNKEDR